MPLSNYAFQMSINIQVHQKQRSAQNVLKSNRHIEDWLAVSLTI